MNWTNLLSSTIRLTDAYDSKRESGSSTTQIGPENRRHHSDGVWFELAVFILEYLQQKDEEIPAAFVSREPLYREIRQISAFRKIQTEDANYIINLLSTPCELKFCLQNVKGTFDTILVEKARAGAGIRLSANGRTACLLAYGIDDWIYTDIDVWKLTKALQMSKFDDFLRRTDNIIAAIRNKSHEITRIKEMPALSERKRKLLADKELYLNTIENTQKIVSDLKIMLDTNESVQKRITEWTETHPDDFIDDITIKNRVNRLLQILESFSRNFSSLIDETQTRGNKLVEPINFYHAGMVVIRNWSEFSPDTFDNLFLLNGFWRPANHQITIGDLIRPRKPSADSEQTRMVVSLTKPEKIPRKIDLFLEKYGMAFRERIMQGPVSLSEIMDEDEWGISEMMHFASLLGVFIDPSKLGIQDGRVVVVANDRIPLKKEMMFGKMKGMDLQMIYLED